MAIKTLVKSKHSHINISFLEVISHTNSTHYLETIITIKTKPYQEVTESLVQILHSSAHLQKLSYTYTYFSTSLKGFFKKDINLLFFKT